MFNQLIDERFFFFTSFFFIADFCSMLEYCNNLRYNFAVEHCFFPLPPCLRVGVVHAQYFIKAMVADAGVPSEMVKP